MGKKYLKLNLFINRDVKILNNYLIEYNNLYRKKQYILIIKIFFKYVMVFLFQKICYYDYYIVFNFIAWD